MYTRQRRPLRLSRWTWLLAVLVLVLPSLPAAAAETDVGLVHTNQIGGESRVVAMGPADTLYVGDGAAIIAAQVTEEGGVLPQTRMRLPALVRQMVVAGHAGYVLTEASSVIYVLDLRTPLAPQLYDASLVLEGAARLRVFGNRLYVATGTAVHFFDISNPLTPQGVAAIQGADYRGLYDVAVEGNMAFVAGETSDPDHVQENFWIDLLFFDMVNPAAAQLVAAQSLPVDVSFWSRAKDARYLHVYDSILYGIGYWTGAGSQYFGFFRGDVSDPTAAWPLYGSAYAAIPTAPPGGSSATNQMVTDMEMGPGYAVVLSDWPMTGGRINTIDLAPPDGIAPLRGSLEMTGGAADLELEGTRGFVALPAGGVARLDLTSPFAPTAATVLELMGRVDQVAHLGAGAPDEIVLLDQMRGNLTRIRISGADPLITGRLTLPGMNKITTQGALAFVNAEGVPGTEYVHIIDLAARPDPALLFRTDFGAYNAIAPMDHRVYFAIGDSIEPEKRETIHLVDLTDPALPSVMTSIMYDNASAHLQVAGNRLYRLTVDGEFQIYDLADSTAPVLLGSLSVADFDDSSRTFQVNGTAAYVVSFNNQVVVVDVANPSKPLSVGVFSTAWPVREMILKGNRLYTAEGAYAPTSKVGIYDVGTPLAPQLLARGALPGQGLDIAVADDWIWAADGSAGMAYLQQVTVNRLFLPQAQAGAAGVAR